MPPSDRHREVVKQTTISMSQPGKLLILDATVEGCNVDNNTDQPIHYHYGVYVDGVGVPGTYGIQEMAAQPQTTGELPHLRVAPAALQTLAAGTHTVEIDLITNDVSVNHLRTGSGRLLVLATH